MKGNTNKITLSLVILITIITTILLVKELKQETVESKVEIVEARCEAAESKVEIVGNNFETTESSCKAVEVEEESNYLIKEDHYYLKSRLVNDFSDDKNMYRTVYDYAIHTFGGEKIIWTESNLYYKPKIEEYSGIVRVRTAYGTNHKEIRYYNTYTKTLSKSFLAPSAYADYLGGYYSNSISLFATFEYDENRNTVLVIYDVFENTIIATIHRDFIAPTSGANNMVFLNENVICIDYDSISNNEERRNISEIIAFRDNDNNTATDS